MSPAVTSQTGRSAPARRRRRRGSSPADPPPAAVAAAAVTPSWTSRSTRLTTPRPWSPATSGTRSSGRGEGGPLGARLHPELPHGELTLPLSRSLYPPITSDGTRQKYKQEFATDLKRYKQLCAEMDGVNDRLNQLSKQLDSITEDSPQYQVRALQRTPGRCGATRMLWGIGDGCCGASGMLEGVGGGCCGVRGCWRVSGLHVVEHLGCSGLSGTDAVGYL